MSRTLKITGLALISAMLIWACGGGSGPKEAGEQYLNALAKGDFDAAAKLADADAKEMISSLKEMGAKAEGKLEIGEAEENDDKAKLKYTYDGKESTLNMKKTDDGWEAEFPMDMFQNAIISANAKKFLDAVNAGEIEEAKKVATKDSHSALDMKSGASPSDVTVAIKSVEVNGGDATVTYTENGGADKTLEMKMEGGQWKAVYSKGGPDGGMGGGADLGEELGEELTKALQESLDSLDLEFGEEDEE